MHAIWLLHHHLRQGQSELVVLLAAARSIMNLFRVPPAGQLHPQLLALLAAHSPLLLTPLPPPSLVQS